MTPIFNENFIEKRGCRSRKQYMGPTVKLEMRFSQKKEKSQTQTRLTKMQSKRALNVVHQNQVK